MSDDKPQIIVVANHKSVFNVDGASCDTCLYEQYGECHRFPPVLYNQGGHPTWAYPQVNKYADWCGEFFQKLEGADK